MANYLVGLAAQRGSGLPHRQFGRALKYNTFSSVYDAPCDLAMGLLGRPNCLYFCFIFDFPFYFLSF
jgi:hypothetical protein